MSTFEDQLILLLGRGGLSSHAQQQARAQCANSLNWEVILQRVTAEEIYPLFYRNLKKVEEQGAGSGEHGANGEGSWVSGVGLRAGSEAQSAKGQEQRAPSPKLSSFQAYQQSSSVINASKASVACPPSVLEQLGGLAKINAFRNTLLTEELLRVLRLFSEAGIPAIPLKGVALAQALYGDPSLRTCVDIDILVPRSMVERAFALLRTDGYKGEFGPGFFANLLLRHNIEYALTRDDRGFDYMVELHWGVMWGGKAEENIADRLWADAYPTTVFGAPAYALSPEWQILFLAAHAARHQWQGLKWLVDLHELYSSPDIDWEKLTTKGQQLGWEDLLRISFLACRALFDTPIPAKYLTGELPSWVKLFPEVASTHLNGAFFATHLLQRRLDKLRYAARVLLIPTLAELRLVALPEFLAFLYYPLRPLRLLCKWGWAGVAKGKGVRAGSKAQSAKSKEWPAAA